MWCVYWSREGFDTVNAQYVKNCHIMDSDVTINGFDSVNLDTTCGVPQGSNQGPLTELNNDLKHASTWLN